MHQHIFILFKISQYTKTCISFCMYLQHNVLNVNWNEDIFNKIVEEYETNFISNMPFWWSYSSQTK